jgi:flagellar motility protein MotE (MotC chaperone)
MADTGIDWEWWDHGSGSEEWKRKMREQNARLQKGIDEKERNSWNNLQQKVVDLEKEYTKLLKERDGLRDQINNMQRALSNVYAITRIYEGTLEMDKIAAIIKNYVRGA